jgi:hypothetical protein
MVTTMIESDLDHLRNEVRRLEAELADLRTELAVELRTSRVVVVAPDGRDRIRLETATDHGSIMVLARSDGVDSTGAELFAVDDLDGDGPEVGLALIVKGDVVRHVRVLTEREGND